jgi:glutamine amidotransferase
MGAARDLWEPPEVQQTARAGDAHPQLEPAHECRLWAMVAPDIPGAALRAHLVDLPNSIKALGQSNDDGWGLAWWDEGDDEPSLRRGEAPASEDAFFDDAVAEAVADKPRIAVAHIRACSSGLCDLPDPHPFQHTVLGRRWLLGHNGTIDKGLLLSLIEPSFLAANPPVNGDNAEEWIDSELYLLLLLQHIEAHGGQEIPAIQAAVQALHAGAGRVNGANFFLSDGQTLWGYRDGQSLYWFHDSVVAPCSAIASEYPTEDRGRWQKLQDGQLVVMRPDGPPELIQIWIEDEPEDETPEI